MTSDHPITLSNRGIRDGSRTEAGAVARLRHHLARPVSPQSLAVIRIAFGLIMVWECWRFLHFERIRRYYVEPEITFPFFGFDWIRPLPEPFTTLAWLLVGLTALMVALGLFYRFAIVCFLVIFTWFFLLDRAQYLNHFYMVILYACLLAVAPAHRIWSLDARLASGVRSDRIPYWPVAALRLQTEIILVFAGIVKIAPDWLAGQPLAMWLRGGAEDRVFYGFLFEKDWAILTGAWGTVALHVLGAPLLLWRRTRLAVFLIYCAFHISNAHLFNIGIFPWLTIAISLIFFDPDWPQQLATRAGRLFNLVPGAVAATGAPLATARIGPALTLTLATWFAMQIWLPMRAWVFPTDVAWAGDGHRFSWRMRIYDRQATGYFIVASPASGEIWTVDPHDLLTDRQADAMMTRADLVHDFAGKLAASWAQRGHTDVEVYARIEKSLNGRPRQPFIDPGTDLARAPYNWFASDPWVLPLSTPLPPLSRAENGRREGQDG